MIAYFAGLISGIVIIVITDWWHERRHPTYARLKEELYKFDAKL
jgi:hypothetical protein